MILAFSERTNAARSPQSTSRAVQDVKGLETLVVELKAAGMPVAFVEKALPYLDLIKVVEEIEGDEAVLGGASPLLMFERLNGKATLTVPAEFFDRNGTFRHLGDLDANQISLLYHEILHLYIESVVPENSGDKIGGIHRRIQKTLLKAYKTLPASVAEDVADELLAYDVQYVINDYLTAKRNIERRMGSRKPIDAKYLETLERLVYHPKSVEARGYSNTDYAFETRMTFEGRQQRSILKALFEGRITGNLKSDFKTLLE